MNDVRVPAGTWARLLSLLSPSLPFRPPSDDALASLAAHRFPGPTDAEPVKLVALALPSRIGGSEAPLA